MLWLNKAYHWYSKLCELEAYDKKWALDEPNCKILEKKRSHGSSWQEMIISTKWDDDPFLEIYLINIWLVIS
jgi:hypothetical protein